jgi:hypothetical protein
MAKTVGKRFSNVRYWRYVFTPILFILMIFGIFMLYTGDKAYSATFPALTGVLRKNMNNGNPMNLSYR